MTYLKNEIVWSASVTDEEARQSGAGGWLIAQLQHILVHVT